jgi:transcription antitermination factor NusG
MSKNGEIVTWANKHGAIRAAVDSPLQWFAAYIPPRHEKHVYELLTERRIEAFLPLYRTARQWKKSRPIVLELPLFPTYVFVRIFRQTRHAVRGLPGVLSLVGSAREPWPLPDFEIDALRRSLQTGRVEPHPYLKVGERVRIKNGMMTGVEGILVRKKNDFRVVLSLETIMRSVAIEVDADDLDPADTPASWIAPKVQAMS